MCQQFPNIVYTLVMIGEVPSDVNSAVFFYAQVVLEGSSS